MAGLAATYKIQGRRKEAEELAVDVLKGSQGENNPPNPPRQRPAISKLNLCEKAFNDGELSSLERETLAGTGIGIETDTRQIASALGRSRPMFHACLNRASKPRPWQYVQDRIRRRCCRFP